MNLDGKMKIEKTKTLISQAIKTCEDFRFEKIKSYLLLALKETNKINEKQNKKISKEKENKTTTLSSKNDLDKIISKIDNLIEKESIKFKTKEEDGVILD